MRRAAAFAGAVLVAGTCLSCGGGDGGGDGREVRLVMTTGRFSPDSVNVRRNEVVRIVLVNNDTQDHEIVIGGTRTHERLVAQPGGDHGGTVVPPGETREFEYTFGPTATELTYACHLDSFYAQGMRGTITVA